MLCAASYVYYSGDVQVGMSWALAREMLVVELLVVCDYVPLYNIYTYRKGSYCTYNWYITGSCFLYGFDCICDVAFSQVLLGFKDELSLLLRGFWGSGNIALSLEINKQTLQFYCWLHLCEFHVTWLMISIFLLCLVWFSWMNRKISIWFGGLICDFSKIFSKFGLVRPGFRPRPPSEIWVQLWSWSWVQWVGFYI